MIIGFHGKLGSGKDTAGERLAQMAAVSATRISFADKLKQSAAAALGVDVRYMEAYKNDPDARIVFDIPYDDPAGTMITGVTVVDITLREYLQKYGTEAHRDVFGDDFWVDQALVKTPEGGLIYVTDVHFPNELQGIQARGGVVVRVLAGDEPEDYSNLHVSEHPLEGCDFTIDNSVRDDNYESLDRQLRAIAEELEIPLKEEAVA